MIIEKKTWPEAFEKIISKKKSFDVRINDFKVKEGDVLVLREWDPKIKDYTGRVIEKKVSYILRTKEAKYWTDEEVTRNGFVIMSLE